MKFVKPALSVDEQLALLLERISPDSRWKVKLLQLIATMPPETPEAMGFPAGWQALAVWAAVPGSLPKSLG